MDVARARQVLGVDRAATWEQVRDAYRHRIRAAHPDRAGGATALAATINDAYTTLARARRAGTLHAPDPRDAHRPSAEERRPGWRWRTPPAAPPAEVLDGDTIHLPLPPDEAFARLLEAAHQVGEVTYVDRSCAIFEAILQVEGEGTCSLVVTLQGRATGTDAFCTLEAIERVASPPVHHVVAALVDAL